MDRESVKKACQKNELLAASIADMNRLIKEYTDETKDVRLSTKSVVVKKWPQIVLWFKTNKENIEQIRGDNVVDYINKTDDEQKEINTKSKAVFKSFRQMLGYGMLEGKVRAELKVKETNMVAMSELLAEMKREANFEGTQKEEKDEKTKHEKEVKQTLMAGKFFDAITGFKRSGEWPAWMSPEKVGSNGTHHIMNHFYAYAAKKVGLEEVGGEDLMNDKAFAILQTELTTGVAQSADDRVDDYDASVAAFLTHIRALIMADRDKKKKEKKEGGEKSEQSIWEAQEANIDRLWGFLYILLKASPDLSLKSFELICEKIEVMIVSYVNQDELAEIFANSKSKALKAVVFDDKGAGTEEKHKFQHPLMVSPKRFGNGASSVCAFFCVGQLLNCFGNVDAAVDQIVGFYEWEKRHSEICKKAFKGKRKDYFKTRVTFWCMHTLLKGTLHAGQWGGLLTNNALNCKLVAV